jgi:PAS domain S-box-containing protein
MSDFKRKFEALSQRTQSLLDANPDLIFRMDSEGRYLDFHAANSSHLAVPPEEFLGHTVREIFGEEFASATRRHISNALATRAIQTWEYPLEIDGETRDFEARLVPSGKNEVVVIVRDVTENKAIYRDLIAIESRLNEAQAIARIGSWERDLKTNEVWWSDEVYRLLELPSDDVAASYENFLARVHPDDRSQVIESVDATLISGEPYSAYHRVVLANKTVKNFHDRGVVVTDEQGKPLKLMGTLQDISDQVEMERIVVSTGEQERERIGRDLHDSLGQILVAISLKLKMSRSELSEGQSECREGLSCLANEMDRAIAELRRVARLLSPRISGLGPALQTLVGQMDFGANVHGQVHCAADHERHSAEVEVQLYRIAQEALNNAIQHSNARNIGLTYVCNGKSISLRISDDGVGISEREIRHDGIGLRNMRYRARMINGTLETRRGANGGTTVICACPCR